MGGTDIWAGQLPELPPETATGGLSSWKTNDDVFVVHAKGFPHCEYLLPIATVGIRFCISNHLKVDKHLSTTLTQTGTTCACRAFAEKATFREEIASNNVLLCLQNDNT